MSKIKIFNFNQCEEMLNKYEHIIWDWNGTIFDDLDLSISIINGLLKKYNLPELKREEYRNYFTMPVKNYYSQIGFDFSKYSFEEVGKEWIDEYERRKFECGLYNGIEKVLKKINALGIGQSILSAYSQHTLEEMVNHFGIRPLFDYVFGKPDLVFKKYRLVIFCDSEFWHGKNWKFSKYKIKTNKSFWIKKIESNIKRDKFVNSQLKRDGWKVIRFWGKEIETNVNKCVEKIIKVKSDLH